MSEQHSKLSNCPKPGLELPTPPRGCRAITLRSYTSVRGHFVANLKGKAKIIGFESRLEWDAALLFLARADVVDLIEQPFKVGYVDRYGKKRHHIFDYLVETEMGSRIAVAVKPAARARKIGLVEELAIIAEQVPTHLADRVYLFTDEHYEPWEAWNAHHLQACRRADDTEADYMLLAIAEQLRGSVSLADLTGLLCLGGRGYKAIVRGLFSGLLAQCTPGRIGPKSLVMVRTA